MPKDLAATIPASNHTGSLLRSHPRLVWWGAAAIALLIGYADLWRGGETIAPILLVLAYCVLIPVAILKR